MTRTAVALDRLAALLIGVLLIVLGAGALVWNTDLFSDTPEAITAPAFTTATTEPWWGWAMAGAGVILLVVGLRWLLSHSPAQRAKTLRLDGTDRTGTLSADLGAVADGVAAALADIAGVQSAKGKAIIDRGLTTLDFSLSVGVDRDLGPVITDIDEVAAQVPRSTGDPGIAVRFRIRAERLPGRPPDRVE